MRWTPEMIEAKCIPEPNTGCWLWLGGAWRSGYGSAYVGEGRSRRAHVVSFEAHAGRRVPKGKMVLHSCDQPACVNPRHLRVGTHRENMADRAARKRTFVTRGSDHYGALVTEEQVRTIRCRYRSGEEAEPLRREFGISKGAVYSMVNGKNWKHVRETES